MPPVVHQTCNYCPTPPRDSRAADTDDSRRIAGDSEEENMLSAVSATWRGETCSPGKVANQRGRDECRVASSASLAPTYAVGSRTSTTPAATNSCTADWGTRTNRPTRTKRMRRSAMQRSMKRDLTFSSSAASGFVSKRSAPFTRPRCTPAWRSLHRTTHRTSSGRVSLGAGCGPLSEYADPTGRTFVNRRDIRSSPGSRCPERRSAALPRRARGSPGSSREWRVSARCSPSALSRPHESRGPL
jgi:hypothetical protein